MEIPEKKHHIGSVRESAAIFDTITSTTTPTALKKISGASEGITHSIDEDEINEFSSNINQVLKDDIHLRNVLPIELDGTSLFTACKNGLILCKLINSVAPYTIDERVLNTTPSSLFQMTENINVVVQSAKSLGCSTVNIGSQDIIEGRPHLVLGLVWQIIKIGLFSKVSLESHPELFRLLNQGESVEDLLRFPPEQLLLRWINYQLSDSGFNDRKANNLSSDLKDGVIYIHLLHKLSPESCSLDILKKTNDSWIRAEEIIKAANKMGCKNYATAKGITSGNSRLNTAFVASLFNKWPGLAPLEKEKVQQVSDAIHESQGDREARSLTMWLNSLGVEPFVTNILWDLRDGTILLQTLSKLYHSQYAITTNSTKRLSRFQMIENTNRVVVFCKQNLKMSLVGIQGADITDGSPTLTKALVWQLMRDHLLRTLRSTSSGMINENDLITWANNQVSHLSNPVGSMTKISSFNDPSLKNSIFLLNLLESMLPESIEWSYVHISDQNSWLENARYVVSVARRMGAALFLLPEDIIECKSKMIMTFVASLMALSLKLDKSDSVNNN